MMLEEVVSKICEKVIKYYVDAPICKSKQKTDFKVNLIKSFACM